jgi:hypothetical protein
MQTLIAHSKDPMIVLKSHMLNCTNPSTMILFYFQDLQIPFQIFEDCCPSLIQGTNSFNTFIL